MIRIICLIIAARKYANPRGQILPKSMKMIINDYWDLYKAIRISKKVK